MLKWEGRDILETLPEIVDPKHTVVLMHDIQNDNTGPGGVFEKDGRRIDVTHLIAPIARFLDERSVGDANGGRPPGLESILLPRQDPPEELPYVYLGIQFLIEYNAQVDLDCSSGDPRSCTGQLIIP